MKKYVDFKRINDNALITFFVLSVIVLSFGALLLSFWDITIGRLIDRKKWWEEY